MDRPNRRPLALAVVLTMTAVASAGAGALTVWTRGGSRAAAQTPSTAPNTKSNHRGIAGGGPVLLADVVFATASVTQSANALSGQVEPLEVATIAADVAEVVASRPVQKGDRVARGQVVALLDTRTARVSLERAVAAAAQASAARRQAESEYERAVVETQAARQQARAALAQAAAGARKTGSFTRQQELRQAQAALAQAQTDERLARIEADRYRTLVAEGAVAQQVMDRTQATLEAATARRQAAAEGVSLAREGARQEDIESAGAQVDSARAGVSIADTRPARLAALRAQTDALRAQEAGALAAVRQARIDLAKHTIRAPFAGRVLDTLIESGERVGPGMPVVRLGSTDRVKMTFSVPEASRSGLRVGQRVQTTADAVPGRRFEGRITALSTQADARTRAFTIEVTVPNRGELLLPNMVARLNLPVGPSDRKVTVPISAVAAEGSQTYVYLLRNNRAERRAVTLGAPLGSRVEVRQGLSGGESLAAAPQRLTDGARIRVAKEEGTR